MGLAKFFDVTSGNGSFVFMANDVHCMDEDADHYMGALRDAGLSEVP